MLLRVPTGIDGLDHVLCGGLPAHRLYLLEGDPGVGKTTLALQFLLAGVAAGERVLYVTLSETQEEVRAIIESHGWSIAGLSMFELSALEQRLRLDAENTIFRPSDVELTETTQAVLQRVDEVAPDRVVFDSLSELRLLAQSALRYRREVLNLKTYFSTKKCTVLLLDDRTSDPGDQQLQSLAHGVISLQQLAPGYGGDRRRLRIAKLRGSPFRSGYHDITIETGGMKVFPRLVAAEHHATFERAPLSSGLVGLDNLLGGGIDRGTSTLLLGGAGTGKSSIMAQYATAAATRGERAVIFAFDELRATSILRADALGMKMSEHVAAGRIFLQQIDPGELSPGELAHRASELVQREHVSFVALDTLNGYLHSMPAEQHLYIQLHELLSYFGQRDAGAAATDPLLDPDRLRGQEQDCQSVHSADLRHPARQGRQANRVRVELGIERLRGRFLLATLAKDKLELMDSRFAVRAVKDHQALFGKAPTSYAYDRAGASESNVDALKKLGVRHVGLPPEDERSGRSPGGSRTS